MTKQATGRRVRAAARGVGEVMMSIGIVLLLLCVYQLWWTNVQSSVAIAQAQDQIVSQWRTSSPTPTVSATPSSANSQRPSPTPTPTPTRRKLVSNQGFALLYIPRLRDKVWGLPIIEGTEKKMLARGAGHYVNSARPGDVGNFGIAAHRSTHDEPFANFPDLQKGDKVYVETATTWYTYTLTRDNSHLSPTDVWVLDPVPGKPNAAPTQQLITMTTCTPRYGSTGRWAWWGILTAQQLKTEGPPDGLKHTK